MILVPQSVLCVFYDTPCSTVGTTAGLAGTPADVEIRTSVPVRKSVRPSHYIKIKIIAHHEDTLPETTILGDSGCYHPSPSLHLSILTSAINWCNFLFGKWLSFCYYYICLSCCCCCSQRLALDPPDVGSNT